MELPGHAVMLGRGRVVGERTGYGQPALRASQASEPDRGMPQPLFPRSRIVEA